MRTARITAAVSLSVFLFAASSAGGAANRYMVVNGGGGPLASGTYHCIVGFSTMLTYGDFAISGNSYTFRAPDGTGGSGTYGTDPSGGLHFTGNFGVLSRAPYVITKAAKQPYVKDAFAMHFQRGDGIDRSMSCRKR